MEYVVLVSEDDQEIGLMEKMEAHRKGLLHRAFSVFIFNSKGEMLLQKRASSKYHSPGLWTNTCCSHPRKNESTVDAAKRRLKEEMGMTCDLLHAFNFTYKAVLDRDMFEHELDHVFIGKTDKLPDINKQEVETYQYLLPEIIQKQIKQHPEQFTEWFKICFSQVLVNHKL